MQVTSISGGNILNIFNPGTYDNSAGTITNYWASCFSPGCGATTKGTFMTINFVAIAPGDTLVEIVPHPPKAIVSDPSGYALEYVLNPGRGKAQIQKLISGIGVNTSPGFNTYSNAYPEGSLTIAFGG